MLIVLSFAIFAYVMYWVIRNAVRGGMRDALKDAGISDGKIPVRGVDDGID